MYKTIIFILLLISSLVQVACSNKPQFKEGANLEKASAINVQLGSGYLAQNKIDLAKSKLEKALF